MFSETHTASIFDYTPSPAALAMSLPPLTPIQSRTLGALLGVHAGDSLGATLEFHTHAKIKCMYPKGLTEIIGGGAFSWPAGHATDDTDMTRAVLIAYLNYHRNCLAKKATEWNDVVHFAGNEFLRWYDGVDWPDEWRKLGKPPKDIGNATAMGIKKFRISKDPKKSGVGEGSAGNGSLMRCIPTALFQPDLTRMEQDSVRISAITHDDKRCTVSCAAYNTIVAALIAGSSPGYAIHAGEACAMRFENGKLTGPVYMAIQEGKRINLKELAEHGLERSHGKDKRASYSGYVLETFSIAIAALLDGRGFRDVVIDVARVGNDTDTNAAVAGGLVGARDGVEMIPREWREKLQFEKEFVATGLEILSML